MKSKANHKNHQHTMKKLQYISKHYPWRVVGTVVVVAAIGTILVVGSRAASPYSSSEAELGSLSGASQQNDATASNGKYVKFGGGDTANLLFNGAADRASLGFLKDNDSCGGQAPPGWSLVHITKSGDVHDCSSPSSACVTIEVVNSPVLSGHKAFKFTNKSCGYRAEIGEGSYTFNANSGSLWFGDVLYIPSQENIAAGEWTPYPNQRVSTIMQLKQDGSGSPPWAMAISPYDGGGVGPWYTCPDRDDGVNNDCLRILPGVGMSNRTMYDRPIAIEIHIIKWSSDMNVGEFEIYVDGQRVMGPRKGQTLMPGLTSYLKQGNYGVGGSGGGNVMYWHGFKIGTTRESVLR